MIPTPLGPMWPVFADGAITRLSWTQPHPFLQGDAYLHQAVKAWLDAYFAGRFLPVPLPMHPTGTPFQQRVWALLQHIPPGTTLTYGEAARQLASGSRAVGNAAGRNPLPLLIPCHRLIAATLHGGGYSAPGGLATKHWLLHHESPPIRA